MSFTEFLQDDPLLTREQVMAELIRVANELNMPDKRGACVIAGMTVSQEAGVKDNDPPYERRFWCPANHADPESFDYPHDSISDDGRSVGYFQQQKGPRGALWWGPTSSEMNLRSAATEFMKRLKKNGYNASNAQAANDAAQAVQQSGVPQAYKQHWDDINRLYDKVSGKPAPARRKVLRGDPVWLPEVLRSEGLSVREMDGWLDRGHGDFGEIWGVVCHHTGSFGETPEGIAFHPTLGLASQIYLGRNGEVVLCGAGVAWHAGSGEWPGIATNGANQVTIGIEAANDGGGSPGKPHRSSWSNAQYNAYVKVVAAILRYLGLNADRCIAHKEWAGRAQGKWDPGAMDMTIFRADVQRQINSKSTTSGDELTPDQDRMLREVWNVLYGRVPSRSIYRDSDEPRYRPIDFIQNDDGMTHQDDVERLAIAGNANELELVIKVAAGMGFDKSQYAVNRAKNVLLQVPTAILKKYGK